MFFFSLKEALSGSCSVYKHACCCPTAHHTKRRAQSSSVHPRVGARATAELADPCGAWFKLLAFKSQLLILAFPTVVRVCTSKLWIPGPLPLDGTASLQKSSRSHPRSDTLFRVDPRYRPTSVRTPRHYYTKQNLPGATPHIGVVGLVVAVTIITRAHGAPTLHKISRNIIVQN